MSSNHPTGYRPPVRGYSTPFRTKAVRRHMTSTLADDGGRGLIPTAPQRRTCEVTTGSRPSARLPCGSRGLFQQQLIDGQPGHHRGKPGHDSGQSNPENHGQELPGRHAQRPGIPVPGRPAAPGLARSVPGPRRGQGCWLGLAGWFEFGDAGRRVHHLAGGLGGVRVRYRQPGAHHLRPKIGGCRGALRREGEDHRTLHGLGHRGLPQRHHLHRHRADELAFFFSFRFGYRQLAHDLRRAGGTLAAGAGASLTCTHGTDGPLPVPSRRRFSRAYVLHCLPLLLPGLSACPPATSSKIIPCMSRKDGD
jgi:hypothetical protein